jgi:hypothetical protein
VCHEVEHKFLFDLSKSNLAHGSAEKLCLGFYAPTSNEMLQSPVFGNITNSQSNQACSSKSRLSIEGTKRTLSAAGVGEALVGALAIKRAR